MLKEHAKWKVLRDIWMLAGKQESGLTIPCNDEREAHRLRQELYAAGRRCRRQRTADTELAETIDKLSITFKSPTSIHIYPQAIPTAILRAKDQVTNTESSESFRRLQEMLAAAEQETKTEIQSPCSPSEKALTYMNPYLLEQKK